MTAKKVNKLQKIKNTKHREAYRPKKTEAFRDSGALC